MKKRKKETIHDDFVVKDHSVALLPPSAVGEFINYAYTNLGIAIHKAPGGKYVIDYALAPIGNVVNTGLNYVKSNANEGIKFVIGERQFNSILTKFHNSPRGVRFLMEDIIDGSILFGTTKIAKQSIRISNALKANDNVVNAIKANDNVRHLSFKEKVELGEVNLYEYQKRGLDKLESRITELDFKRNAKQLMIGETSAESLVRDVGLTARHKIVNDPFLTRPCEGN